MKYDKEDIIRIFQEEKEFMDNWYCMGKPSFVTYQTLNLLIEIDKCTDDIGRNLIDDLRVTYYGPFGDENETIVWADDMPQDMIIFILEKANIETELIQNFI